MNATRFELIQAVRGPIMLITLGTLVALDYFQGISFGRRSWPVLLIVFGLMKLLEMAGRPPVLPPPVYPPPGPYAAGPTVPPGGNTI